MESICISYMDVGYYEIILDHLLLVFNIVQINPILCETIKPTIFVIYFNSEIAYLGPPKYQSVLAIWMWVTMKSF